MWIEFDGIVNARDLGGIPAAGGKRVKPGRLLRGAGLGKASDADVERLRGEFHLRHVIDLRDGAECERTPNRAVPGAEEHTFPALPQLFRKPPTMDAEPDFDTVFRHIYADLAGSDAAATAYAKLFRVLLDCPDGAVYFHCNQGKDRTGVAALLILTALGTELEEAKKDYFLSNVGLKDAMAEPASMGARPWSRQTIEKLFFVFPEILDVYLNAIRDAWGGLDGYLRGALGLTDADLDRLRREYLV